MFDISRYPYDTEHHCLFIADEAMIFHCHHYLTNLLRTILDADYIDSRPFLIGSAAHAVHRQLSKLCEGMDTAESKRMAEEVYKTLGCGLIDLSNISERGGTVTTTKSVMSKTWKQKYGLSTKPVDYYTTGYLAAAYSVIYKRPLDEVNAEQSTCMACGAEANTHRVSPGDSNFKHYPAKSETRFCEAPRLKLNWEHEATITNAFLGSHVNFVGNEEGMIPAFGVHIVRNQSDYVNRLQFEFVNEMTKVAGDYGVTLAGELLMEAGHACGFFTYGGIMTSPEWNEHVRPYLDTKEDWIYGLLALVNTMGWGYHTVVELAPDRAIFRNYNDFEDLSHMRMYGHSDYPVHWANSGGFTGLMQLVYNTDLVNGERIETEEGFRKMRRSTQGYKTRMTKSIACGDDYLEVEIFL
ncbi:MAG: 4-vinyl reductase [Chromatiales bacterium]|nr:4-vinyl reductase [Chromatiales bacterium]